MVTATEKRQDTIQKFGVLQFAGTVREELAKRTAEEVVEYLIHDEAKRTKDTKPETESEVRLAFKSELPVVQAGLECMAERKSRGYYLITKCLAHKAVYLLQDIPGLTVLNGQYADIVRLNGRHGGLTSIVDQADVAQYIPSTQQKAPKPGEFRMAAKIKSTLGSMTKGIGVDLYLLAFFGLGAVLAETNDPELRGIADDIKKEVDAFKVWVRDRALLMDAYWNIAQLHLKDAGKIANIPDAVGMFSKHTDGG